VAVRTADNGLGTTGRASDLGVASGRASNPGISGVRDMVLMYGKLWYDLREQTYSGTDMSWSQYRAWHIHSIVVLSVPTFALPS
jgi:hypothetical protein